MRDIKFRAWNKHLGKMEEEVCINEYGEVIHFDYGEYAGVTDDIVMQYTGLKDKNGTEIYEGDIVKYITRKPMLPETYTVRGVSDFQHMRILEKLINSTISDVKVIGNIYENPELLENER